MGSSGGTWILGYGPERRGAWVARRTGGEGMPDPQGTEGNIRGPHTPALLVFRPAGYVGYGASGT